MRASSLRPCLGGMFHPVAMELLTLDGHPNAQPDASVEAPHLGKCHAEQISDLPGRAADVAVEAIAQGHDHTLPLRQLLNEGMEPAMQSRCLGWHLPCTCAEHLGMGRVGAVGAHR